jgi:hypothetical protein
MENFQFLKLKIETWKCLFLEKNKNEKSAFSIFNLLDVDSNLWI